jgi:micrococcal nuclease
LRLLTPESMLKFRILLKEGIVKKLTAWLALAFLLLAVTPCCPWSGKCVGIADGGTIRVMHQGKAERIRLYGIDCPERGQDFGTRASKFASDMVFGEVEDVEPVDRDQYGRTVAWVSVNGKSLNKELLRAGLAWWFRRYAPDRADLARLEREARKAKVGLWSHPNPIPPWQFRRRRM